MSRELTEALLGRDAQAITEHIIHQCNEKVAFENGDTLWRFPKESPIKELVVSASNRIIRCGYTEERRCLPRITPAHFISVAITDSSDRMYMGMILDLAKNSLRARLKERPDINKGELVDISFSFPEGGESNVFKSSGRVVRTATFTGNYHIILSFSEETDEDSPFSRYIKCRECEIVFGDKWCPKMEGKRCKETDLAKGC